MSVTANVIGESGVVEVTILTSAYGQAGEHWREVLESSAGDFGQIYVQRADSKTRRYWHTQGSYEFFRGERGVNQDECPGAMFVWTAPIEPHVEAVDAIDNQNLGRDVKNALSEFRDEEMWEVRFRFI